MLRVVLIRPGSTDFDEQGRIQGTLSVPLNEQGGQEVARLARELAPLGIQLVYFSPGEPAHQTAAAIAAALEVRLKELKNMHNLDHGLWQGKRIDEIKQSNPKVFRQWQEQPECVCPPCGETLEQAQERVATSLRKLFRKHEDETIALVAPAPLCRLVQSYVSGCELGNLWTASEEHGQYELLEVEPRLAARR
jgi:broad specificity phosphatase PhoE